MKAATVEAATVKTAKCSMEAASAPGVKSTTSSAVEPAAPTAVEPAAASATNPPPPPPPPLAIAGTSVTMQSAPTATLVARIPIIFLFMAFTNDCAHTARHPFNCFWLARVSRLGIKVPY
jgi:hypothetical protein